MTNPVHPMVSSFRPPTGMRCDSRLLSSFVTGALTATTVTVFLLRVVPGTYVVLPCDPTITHRPVLLDEYLDSLDKHQEVFPEESLIDTRPLHVPFFDGQQLKERQNRPPKQEHLQRTSEGDEGKKTLKEEAKETKQERTEDEKTKKKKKKEVGERDVEDQHLQKEKRLQQELQQMKQKLQQDLEEREQKERKQIHKHQQEIQLYLQEEERERKNKQAREAEDMMKRERAKLQRQMEKKRERRDTENEKLVGDKPRKERKTEEPGGKKKRENDVDNDKTEAKEKSEKQGRGNILRPPDSIILRSLLSLGLVGETQRQHTKTEGKERDTKSHQTSQRDPREREKPRKRSRRTSGHASRVSRPNTKRLFRVFRKRELLSRAGSRDSLATPET
ncbi:trichohyalin-like [Penaeus chinensis]|uniref:trichohyalin-like n=1 Tax=Penaeus chinensis TaxID=139456 RepID=UPI001FB742AA|nr:trichohyalin-like [Penaeus chinensis]